MIPDISSHNRSELDFLPGAAPIEIYKSIHSLQYSSDLAETWSDDTKHQSAQSCGSGCFDFFTGGVVRAHLLRSSNRFTAYSFYAIELKLGRMILDISLHNRLESDFPFSPRGAVGARLLKFSNRFTAYSIYPIELKLSMIIPRYRSAQSV